MARALEKAAEKTLYLIEHPEEAQAMGKKERKHVKENSLVGPKASDTKSIINCYVISLVELVIH